MRELAAMGLAREEAQMIGKTTRTHWRISAEGHRLLGDVMARNGRRSASWNRARAEGSTPARGS